METLKTLIERKYRDRHREHMEALINGVQDWAEYRFQLGYLRGMHDFAEDIAPYIADPESAADEAMIGGDR